MDANHKQATTSYPEDYDTTENFSLLKELEKKDEIQQLCLLQQEQAQTASPSSTLGNQLSCAYSMLQEKDKQLAEKDRQLEEKDRQLEEKDRQFEGMIRKWQETAVRNQQEVLRQLHETDTKQRAERWNQIACSVRREQALASGSWGIVHKGTLPVAIKELKHITPESLKLFQREIDAAFFCHHPNIVEFLGATNNLHHGSYIVMELMDCNLRDFIKHENYQLPQKIIVSFALDIAKGLSYLHGHNPPILHRDLKTDNILLKRGTAKIGDLGSAKVQQDSMTPYRGTLLYTAPEALNSNIQTPKMDVWSYGLVVQEMAIGKRPDPCKLSEQVQQVTCCPKLKELVTACTEIQLHQRPSMQVVVRVLKERFTE
ncbi:uncharacterized protein [Porites lutea]|uniref:uncharacterized protein n=1 Tax=Porites lutea TaxID=51062 RepID=UPI003CC666CD